jgi:hypothetical protein
MGEARSIVGNGLSAYEGEVWLATP